MAIGRSESGRCARSCPPLRSRLDLRYAIPAAPPYRHRWAHIAPSPPRLSEGRPQTANLRHWFLSGVGFRLYEGFRPDVPLMPKDGYEGGAGRSEDWGGGEADPLASAASGDGHACHQELPWRSRAAGSRRNALCRPAGAPTAQRFRLRNRSGKATLTACLRWAPCGAPSAGRSAGPLCR